ncbi:Helix-turn-helix [Aromatoleum tolulyticum]|uniref:Helix-turn-helix n=1 Tax=Aromatoleum tolulyticum TaxID=34027 RepID=A0A1N6WYW8_9RHOO|nr:helix-turn-helix transcriptional regulator [Aromatoleum tolulyticum]SIQ95215.1 Helix-turn-helix [Aromatoleum tolulyticum]
MTKSPARSTLKENRNSSDLKTTAVPIRSSESEQFKDRLRETIGDRKLVWFAKECGFSDSLLGAYLRGEKLPGLENLVAMANVGGVSIDWLATGRPPKTRAELRAAGAAPAAGLDQGRLQLALATVEEGLAATRRVMAPDKKAELVLAVYDLYQEPSITRDRVLKLVKSAA